MPKLNYNPNSQEVDALLASVKAGQVEVGNLLTDLPNILYLALELMIDEGDEDTATRVLATCIVRLRLAMPSRTIH